MEKGAGRLLDLARGKRSPEMTTDALSVVIVVLFALFAGVVAYIIRPLNRRKSPRRIALSAGADSQGPPFIEAVKTPIEPIERSTRRPHR